MYRHLKLPINKDISLKNRVVTPAMASQTADQYGAVTQLTLDHYSRLAQAQSALLIVEYTYVHSSGRSEDNQLGVDSDDQIPGLSRLAQLIKDTGSIAGLQITHSGGKSERKYTGGDLIGPSAVAVPVRNAELESMRPIKALEIANWKKWFVDAAHRAYRAGFDLVEIHAAHGYGMNQWLSPITNQRNDEYGGDLARRSKILIDVVRAIKAAHPDKLVSVRIPGQDLTEGGLSIADMKQISRWLEIEGVDFINVSSGIGGWRRPRDRQGQGYFIDEAAGIQGSVSIPVIGVGGIQQGSYIDCIVKERRVALAAVGRAILNDPKQWYLQQMSKNVSVT